jgi:hypothetical protein
MTQGAIIASAVRPAIKVCVLHDPNGASITRRSPRGAHPLSRVRFVFTEVSSMKTTRSDRADTAGMRCLNQSSRCRLTLIRRRSAATGDFFVCITELAKKLAYRIRVRAHAGRVMPGRRQFRHCDVSILRDDFCKETAMGIELSLAPWTTLRGSARLSSASDRKPPPRPKRIWQRC